MINKRGLFLFVTCLLICSACSTTEPTGKKITSFSFTDQNGQDYGMEELDGNIWIASFIFTNCDTVCPPMMYEMAGLQKELAEEHIDVHFVSFTVDPNLDTPEVLREYQLQFTKDQTNWHMLTGYSQNEIETFAMEQFQTIIQKPDSSNQVIHGTNFYLIDEQGYLRNEYNFMDDAYIEEMIKQIKAIHK